MKHRSRAAPPARFSYSLPRANTLLRRRDGHGALSCRQGFASAIGRGGGGAGACVVPAGVPAVRRGGDGRRADGRRGGARPRRRSLPCPPAARVSKSAFWTARRDKPHPPKTNTPMKPCAPGAVCAGKHRRTRRGGTCRACSSTTRTRTRRMSRRRPTPTRRWRPGAPTTRSTALFAWAGELAQQLRALGCEVVHDTTDHELDDLSTAYTRSEETLLSYEEPFDLYIDLHPRRLRGGHGRKRAARGRRGLCQTDDACRPRRQLSGQAHFDENYAFARALTDALNADTPASAAM